MDFSPPPSPTGDGVKAAQRALPAVSITPRNKPSAAEQPYSWWHDYRVQRAHVLFMFQNQYQVRGKCLPLVSTFSNTRRKDRSTRQRNHADISECKPRRHELRATQSPPVWFMRRPPHLAVLPRASSCWHHSTNVKTIFRDETPWISYIMGRLLRSSALYPLFSCQQRISRQITFSSAANFWPHSIPLPSPPHPSPLTPTLRPALIASFTSDPGFPVVTGASGSETAYPCRAPRSAPVPGEWTVKLFSERHGPNRGDSNL